MSFDLTMHTEGHSPVARNLMDISNLLNPCPALPVSKIGTVMEEGKEDGWVNTTLDKQPRHFSVIQPMEVGGETHWSYSPPWQFDTQLPPVRLSPAAHESAADFWPSPNSSASEISVVENLDRNNQWTIDCRRPSLHSQTFRRTRDRRSDCRRRTSAGQTKAYPSPATSSAGSLSDDGASQKNAPKRKRKSTGTHSNRAYSQEQMHWLQYFHEDCGLSYSDMHPLWARQFPHPDDARGDGQSFCSRSYRSHKVPKIDENGEPIIDEDGKPTWKPCKVRERKTNVHDDVPFKLVERHPEWALYWPWVSQEHKAIAQKILDGKDLDPAQMRKEKYRRAIRKLDAKMPCKIKGWYSSPAHHAEAMRQLQSSQQSKTPSTAASSPSSIQSSAPSDWTVITKWVPKASQHCQ